MALVTLQTLFQDAFPAYEHTHPLPAHVRKPRTPLCSAGTAALGGHIQACPDGQPSLPGLVQFVPPPGLSAVRVSPDRALAGPPTSAAAGL